MASTTQTKPQNDAYTGILFISLLALIGACALLYMDYEQYGSRTVPSASKSQLDVLPKSIDKSGTTTTIPMPAPTKTEPAKVEPQTMMRPPVKPRETEVTTIRPLIQAPPVVPATIPTLEVPGIPPLPVLTSDEGKVVSAKFETLAPVKPILDVTPMDVSKPVSPMKEIETFKPISEVTPTVPVTRPAVAPSLYDGPPVVRPFVPEK